jgi:LssY C-terminus
MPSARLLGIAALLVCLAGFGPVCAAASPNSNSASVTVGSDSPWTDSGMDVSAGDTLHIAAKGTVNFADKPGVTPEGAQRGWTDTLRALTVPNAGRGALIGRVGNNDAATPFFIGADGTILAPVAGRLYLGINRDPFSAPEGKFEVHIDRTAAARAAGSSASASSGNYDFKPLFAELDQKLPYRVQDQAKNPGDLVNFVLIGSKEQVTDALKAAGWLQADTSDTQAVFSAILATLNKDVYVAVPMSTLYLFDRPQDLGYERAEAVKVAAQRNHFRVWNTPFTAPDNQPVWAGAGTHDIGFERDQRTANGITHKIDQDVDNERDFIGETLQQAGRVEAMQHMIRSNPIKEAKTATGGNIKSDGRVLVIVLKPAQKAAK